MKRHILRFIETIETAPLTLTSFSTAFLGIIVVRLLVESGVTKFKADTFFHFFFQFSHTFLFFLLAFLVFLPVARFAGAASWKRAVNLLLFGFLVIWTPPLIDKWIFQDQFYWSFYALDGLRGLFHRYLMFFGDSPDIGITYGVRVEVAIMTILLGIYALLRSGKILRAAATALIAYTIFFILGTFPSYVAIIPIGMEKGFSAVGKLDIAGYMLTPSSIFSQPIPDPRSSLGIKMSLVFIPLIVLSIGMFLWYTSRSVFRSLLRNIRLPQVIWHGGLLFLGGAFAMLFGDARPDFTLFEGLAILVLVMAVESAWIASVIGNDITDLNIDERTNPSRPLPTHSIPKGFYAEIGVLFFVASILFSAVVSFKIALLLLAYQTLAWIYSMPPLRLKRFPLVATFLSSLAGVIIILVGYYAISVTETFPLIPTPLLGFLFVAYVVSIPVKDFKDIEGDRADGVWTIPVLLGAERARLAIGSAIFLCYAASPIVFREPRLIVPAILFASCSFWAIVRAERSRHPKLSFRTLPGWNMLFITLYGLIAALILI